MIKNNSAKYGLVSTYVHWISAILVIGLFALGFWMVELNYYSEWYRTAPFYHKSFGLLLVIITLARVVWKFISPPPAVIGDNKLEKTAAKIAHLVLYITLLALLISGYLISTADGRGIEFFTLFEVPSAGELIPNQEDVAGLVHEYLAYFVIFLASVHALAALKHHFINKDNTLKRMTRFK